MCRRIVAESVHFDLIFTQKVIKKQRRLSSSFKRIHLLQTKRTFCPSLVSIKPAVLQFQTTLHRTNFFKSTLWSFFEFLSFHTELMGFTHICIKVLLHIMVLLEENILGLQNLRMYYNMYVLSSLLTVLMVLEFSCCRFPFLSFMLSHIP